MVEEAILESIQINGKFLDYIKSKFPELVYLITYRFIDDDLGVRFRIAYYIDRNDGRNILEELKNINEGIEKYLKPKRLSARTEIYTISIFDELHTKITEAIKRQKSYVEQIEIGDLVYNDVVIYTSFDSVSLK